MTPADVLEAAADALFIHGRARGDGVDDTGAMCVEGAICFVQGIDPWDWATVRTEATRALEVYLGIFPAAVWNDSIGDDAEVIDTLRHCAKALREVEAP